MPKYDVAVVGAGLGGLAVAALLSGMSKKTIVFEPGESVEQAAGAFEKEGFIFISAPPLSYGFEPGGAINELCAKLGIISEISIPSPCHQVALPDRRITVYPEWINTLEELKREFPDEIDALVRFHRELHKEAAQNANSRIFSYLSKRRAAAGFLRKYRFSRELTAFLDIQSLFFFKQLAGELSISSLITLCDTPPKQLHDGFKGLAGQLYEVIRRQGGDVSCGERVPELVMRNNRVIGIKTSRGVIEADSILINRVRQRSSSTLFIGLRNEVVPVGMCRQVLFLPDYSQPREFISLSLNREDDGNAPRGMRALTASFHFPQGLKTAQRAMIEQINKLIPFLDEYLVFAEARGDLDGESGPQKETSFQPLRSEDGISMLYKGPKKNVFLLDNAQNAPLQAISAAHRFIIKSGNSMGSGKSFFGRQ